jgi:potassium-dependent mechanosensitive channel
MQATEEREMKSNQKRENFLGLQLLLVVLGCLLAVGTAAGQADSSPAAEEMSETREPTPIPAANVAVQARLATALLRTATEVAAAAKNIQEITNELPGERDAVAQIAKESQALLVGTHPSQTLEEQARICERRSARQDAWLKTVAQRAVDLDEQLRLIRTERETWMLTRDGAAETDLPEASIAQISVALQEIDTVIEVLGDRRAQVLTLQAEILVLRAKINDQLRVLRDELERRNQSILQFDSPPLWTALATLETRVDALNRIQTQFHADIRTLADYIAEETPVVIFQGSIFLLALLLLWLLKRQASRWAQDDESLHTILSLLQRSLPAALLLAFLLDGPIHEQAPNAWRAAISYVGVGALLGLLPVMLPRRQRRGLWFLAVMFLLARLWGAVPDATMLNRVILLLLSVIGLVALRWFYSHVRDVEARRISKPGAFSSLVGTLLCIGAIILSVSTLLNITGSVALAGLLCTGVLKSAFFGLLLWLAALVLDGVVLLVLRSDSARRLRMVSRKSTLIGRSVTRVIHFAAFLVWGGRTLAGFRILEWFVTQIKAVFGAELTAGTFSISLADVVFFFLAIWLAFRLSRILRFVLDEDVLPRVPFPRGVPNAISKGVHYLVLLLGFLVAIAGAGIDLSKFALLAGAFGVGLGFGMQNIVSNFVSGLVLLFERPIQVGDKVQLDQLSGVVKEIGLRASTVRTWQGAEVIVPNSNLIESELINWTLSDERRRIEIKLGVTYGTDPELMRTLLLDVAKAHEEVLDDPAPSAYFRGFGDSALEFELWAWTVADFVRVQSEMTVAISRALREAGIQIPFPQREVHVHPGSLPDGGTPAGKPL